MESGTGFSLSCVGSAHDGAFASRMVTISPSYVSYTPTRQPQGSNRLDSPRRTRILVVLDRRILADV